MPVTRFSIPDDRIGLLGDIHGRTETTPPMFEAFCAAGITTVFQLGDFGLPWHLTGMRGVRDRVRISDLSRYAADAGVELVVALRGNHEQAAVLADLEDPDGWVRFDFAERVRIAPRTAIGVTPSGARIALVSGAGSVDRSYRYPGSTWFPNEVLSQRERDVFAADAAGQIDVVLAHDAPGADDETTALGRRLRANTGAWGPEDLAYAQWENRLFTRLVTDLIDPRGAISVSGHMHFAHDADEVFEAKPLRVVVLSETGGQPRSSYGILDVTDPRRPLFRRPDPDTGGFGSTPLAPAAL